MTLGQREIPRSDALFTFPRRTGVSDTNHLSFEMDCPRFKFANRQYHNLRFYHKDNFLGHFNHVFHPYWVYTSRPEPGVYGTTTSENTEPVHKSDVLWSIVGPVSQLPSKIDSGF